MGMYRVLLRVERIEIRIREGVRVEVAVWKEGFCVVHSEAWLQGGVATPEASSQFLLSSRDPLFQIRLLLLTETTKRLGGCAQVTLGSLLPDLSHFFAASLTHTIDKRATLILRLVFWNTDVPQTKSLLSMKEYEGFKHQNQLQYILKSNSKLEARNSSLSKRLHHLQQTNNRLQRQNEQMQKEVLLAATKQEKEQKQKQCEHGCIEVSHQSSTNCV